jgi:hypothetical protein
MFVTDDSDEARSPQLGYLDLDIRSVFHKTQLGQT